MPVTKQPNGPAIITPAKQLNTLDGQISGSTRDRDFSVTEYHDPSIQFQVDLSDSLPGGISVLKSATGLSTTAVYTLPPSSGTLATTGGTPTGSFTTVQTPTGTSPVATGTMDVLTLTSSDLTITGNSVTDTVNYALSTVNSNVGGFGTATQVASLTVTATGRVTAASSVSIQIAESQVTNLVSDLASKQATGNYITALNTDVSATGPGAVAATIAIGAVTDTKGSLANKPACTVVATTNQTLTGFPTIDGITVVDGSIILLSNQSSGAENGPWVSHVGAWTRPTWYPNGGTTQAFQFITTLIRVGTTYQGTIWRMTSSGAITIDTTTTTWVVTPLSLNASSVTGQLPIANGGTGAATAAAALTNLGAAASLDVQVFTVSGTWNKPAGAKFVNFKAVGAGGGGGGGAKSGVLATLISGGGGGGGGAGIMFNAVASDLSTSVAITIGAGGTGGAGATIAAAGADGVAGGNTVLGSLLTCFGGGFGSGGTALGTGSGGGAGASTRNAGGTASGATGGTGGSSWGSSGGSAAAGTSSQSNGGGAGGGGCSATGTGTTSGAAIAGGGGGGSGGGVTAANAGQTGGAAQRWDSGTNITAGNPGITQSNNMGSGGSGGSGVSASTGGAGSVGGNYGGAGGGGGATQTGAAGGVGGTGANGYVVITTEF